MPDMHPRIPRPDMEWFLPLPHNSKALATAFNQFNEAAVAFYADTHLNQDGRGFVVPAIVHRPEGILLWLRAYSGAPSRTMRPGLLGRLRRRDQRWQAVNLGTPNAGDAFLAECAQPAPTEPTPEAQPTPPDMPQEPTSDAKGPEGEPGTPGAATPPEPVAGQHPQPAPKPVKPKWDRTNRYNRR